MENLPSDLGHVIWGMTLHTFGVILIYILQFTARTLWHYLPPKLKSYLSRRYGYWRNKRILSNAPGGHHKHTPLALRQGLGKKIRNKKKRWTRLKPLRKKPDNRSGETGEPPVTPPI